MRMNPLSERLYQEIRTIPVIDTHEHLCWTEENAYEQKGDVLREYLYQYMSSDLVSAGLKRGDFAVVCDPERPIMERWRIAEPYWEAARYTGYGRALDIAAEGIYGVPGIHRETIESLNEKYVAARKPGHYAHVLRDLCGIEKSLLDVWSSRLDGENSLFERVWQPTAFIAPNEESGTEMLADIKRMHGITVKTLDDWLEALKRELEHVLSTYGVRILKCAIAYQRSLRFEQVEYAVAKGLFDSAVGDTGVLRPFPKQLQDYVMHALLKMANARNLTIQFHTGILEGNGNTLSNSDPSLLNSLFLLYPDVDFDLFHISYPYQNVACALAKMFPNVFIDMCWAHIISPAASVAALNDFLDAVPYNKISAFGGDYSFVDGVYGHLELSRRNVAAALAQKVENGVFSEEKAIAVARALYNENPRRIFKL